MSRKKDNSPAISFFSFQDIITSVTGIMFLVVLILILILMLLARQHVTAEEMKEVQDNALLQEELDRLTAQMEAVRRQASQLQLRVQQMGKISLDEIPDRKNALLQQLEQIDIRLRQHKQKNQQLVEQKLTLQEEKQAYQKKLQLGGEQLKSEDDQNRLLTQKEKQVEKQLNTVRKTMKFTWDRQSAKIPVLVECSGDRIAVGEEGNALTAKVFSGKDCQKQFLNWTNGCSRDRIYFLLLVKPSAFDYAEKLSLLLSAAGFERGREVLPGEDSQILEAQK